MKTTELFIVIDETNLLTMKDNQMVQKFSTYEEANDCAAYKLEVWSVVKIHFEHKFIQHKIK